MISETNSPTNSLLDETTINTNTTNSTSSSLFKRNTDTQLGITVHNVQGINVNLKYLTWLQYCNNLNTDIIIMTETKLSADHTHPTSLANPWFKTYTANCNEYNASTCQSVKGVAIALKPYLQPYIHDIKSIPGYALAIDLFFPNNNKTRIIGVYIPSQSSIQTNSAQQTIINWIQQARSFNFNTIIAGDFNSNANRKKPSTLITYLISSNLISLLNFYNIDDPTWQNNNTSSQIDDI